MTEPPSTGRVIRTVTGDVPLHTIGPTLMHEHILCDLTHPDRAAEPEIELKPENSFDARYHWDRYAGNHRLRDRAIAAAELRRFRAAGGDLVVELTTLGIAPDPTGLAAVSQASGVRIVMGCGTYVADYARGQLTEKSVDALTTEMVRAIREGFGDTGVRSGIIGEIGLSDPWHPAEERALIAAALASCETGAAVNVHPSRSPESALATVSVFEAAGGDPARLILSHMDRMFPEADGPLRLADLGATVEWDFFGINDAHYPYAEIDLPHDGRRLDLVRTMIDHGHLQRVTISHDICTKTRLTRWGGHGYAHISENIVPMMRRKGFSDSEIDGLLVENPRRLLSLPDSVCD